ncbi:MAG: ABC transporter permease [Candidatus Bipolaricaulis sp.]|nr:ABC transporter permease [Candidatus Bipolaricaulis sp.]
MTAIFAVARTYLVTACRERETLFWFLLFPLLLLTLLALIFGNIGESGAVTYDIAIVNFDSVPGAAAAEGVVAALGSLSMAEGENQPLFRLHTPAADSDPGAFLADELEALRIGERAAVIEIPQGLSASILAAAYGGITPALAVRVHKSGGRTNSDMAAAIVEDVVAQVDRALLVKLGLYDETRAVRVDRLDLGADAGTFSYVDFVVPAIVIMGFFVVGLFGVPGTILFGRERKILRVYWVTPLDVPRYFSGFALGHLVICAMQLISVWALGQFAFGAHVALFRPLPLLVLLIASMTFLAFGFLVASLARTANGGMALANIVNMPMMFLGGLFYPLGQLPPVVRAIMMANPLTYLADALRGVTGTAAPSFPLGVSLGVPAAWIVVCAAVASWRLTWDVER